MKQVGVVGASGRTGGRVVAALKGHSRCSLRVALVSTNSTSLGGGIAGTDLLYSADFAELASCDVVIDFSTPEGSLQAAQVCGQACKPILIGTTGHTDQQLAQLSEFADRIPVALTPNTSIGATVLGLAAEYIKGLLGDDFDVELLDLHHRMKRDAPSGTARMIAQGLIQGRGVITYGRDGLRRAGELGVASLRGGDVCGDHTVFFLGDGERIEVTHRVSSRDVFGFGAIRLAEQLIHMPPGIHSVRDLLVRTK